ncbi:hypothetical protein ACJJTC_007844 [Scirpophaga incertulas]
MSNSRNYNQNPVKKNRGQRDMGHSFDGSKIQTDFGNQDSSQNPYGYLRKYIILPIDEITDLESDNILNKRNVNISEGSNTFSKAKLRKVLIQESRALMSGYEDELKIHSYGSDFFLILPHLSPQQAQIDIEARADENEVVRVGGSGSLVTIVTDNSRQTRSTIMVRAINKGLSAARFKIIIRDCGPQLADLIDKSNKKAIEVTPFLIAPRHIHDYSLELPFTLPVNNVLCSVAMINDEEESVAVRELSIRKGDRCFCIWHCDCVCLSEDPKLLCRELSEARQLAAGLTPRGRPRRMRSACYPDVLAVNLFVVATGVLIALLMLGLTKAILGLFCRCVAQWGINCMIETPRKLDEYYEANLKQRPVEYDEEGWPIHPDTKKRTVRLISMEMEFILNVILFITLPSIMLWHALAEIGCRSVRKCRVKRSTNTKKNIANHDEQMCPLLKKDNYTTNKSPCIDSEQDDKEYVLTQLQKSRESLDKSRRRQSTHGATISQNITE